MKKKETKMEEIVSGVIISIISISNIIYGNLLLFSHNSLTSTYFFQVVGVMTTILSMFSFVLEIFNIVMFYKNKFKNKVVFVISVISLAQKVMLVISVIIFFVLGVFIVSVTGGV